MQTKIKAAAATAAVLLGGFAVIGAANASGAPSQAKPATTSTVTTADPDTLQQGDQTTPDKPGGADKETGNAGGTESTNESGTENANETASESGAANDGPGGHADGPGNVDHQFEGQE